MVPPRIAALLGVLLLAPPAAADLRFADPELGRRWSDEGPVDLAYRTPEGCSVRRTVLREHARFGDRSLIERAAPLAAYEIGFRHQAGALAAFFGFRLAAPERLEAPALAYGASRFSDARWTATGGAGTAGASVPVAALAPDEIRDFFRAATWFFALAALLPDSGEDRVWRLGDQTGDHDHSAFAACVCALEAPRVTASLGAYCERR